MRGVNKSIILGNLGADPELRNTPGGNPVANLSVATSEQWRDKETGEKKEQTEWHRIVMFGRLAEIAGEYLKKGSKVYLEGKMQTRKWQDREGIDRYTTEVVAREMQMLDSPRDSGNQRPVYPETPKRKAQPANEAPMDNSDLNDDVPF